MEQIIGFWKPNKPYGFMSQWYISPFKDDERTYNCAEQYMMAQKAILFGDTDTLKLIMEEHNPADMKKYGRMIKNFDGEVWDNKKYDIVVQGNLLKFSQNPDLAKALKSTGNAILCEASPYDTIWGIGSEYTSVWKGENLLGKAIMEVREKI